MHGPRFEDVLNARNGNGVALQRISPASRHLVSYNDAASWASQWDNFSPFEGGLSGVGIAGDGSSPGKFVMAWRRFDGNDRLQSVSGWSNGWDFSTQTTHAGASGNRGSLGQPSVATDTVGNYLTVIAATVDGSLASNDRQIFQVIRNATTSSQLTAVTPYASTADAPKAKAARVANDLMKLPLFEPRSKSPPKAPD